MMTDPLGLINQTSPGYPIRPPNSQQQRPPGNEPGFKEFLQQQIHEVNQLQQDATRAVEDLATGRRDDVESVIIATQKADTAFRMLMQIRNKMIDAYQDVKQLRV